MRERTTSHGGPADFGPDPGPARRAARLNQLPPAARPTGRARSQPEPDDQSDLADSQSDEEPMQASTSGQAPSKQKQAQPGHAAPPRELGAASGIHARQHARIHASVIGLCCFAAQGADRGAARGNQRGMAAACMQPCAAWGNPAAELLPSEADTRRHVRGSGLQCQNLCSRVDLCLLQPACDTRPSASSRSTSDSG
jgi:hypothetical protein